MSRQTKYLNALALACALSLPLFVQAHEGHDDAPPALSGDSPRRQSDGSVFIPKSAQRQLGLRTLADQREDDLRLYAIPGPAAVWAAGRQAERLTGLHSGDTGAPQGSRVRRWFKGLFGREAA